MEDEVSMATTMHIPWDSEISIYISGRSQNEGSVTQPTPSDSTGAKKKRMFAWSQWSNRLTGKEQHSSNRSSVPSKEASAVAPESVLVRTVPVVDPPQEDPAGHDREGKSKLSVKFGFDRTRLGWISTHVDSLRSEGSDVEQISRCQQYDGFPSGLLEAISEEESFVEKLETLIKGFRGRVDWSLSPEGEGLPSWWLVRNETTRSWPYKFFMLENLGKMLDEVFAEAKKQILAGQSQCIDHVIHLCGVGSECGCTGEARKVQTVRSEYGKLISVEFSF
jgi:hypothetical protein